MAHRVLLTLVLMLPAAAGAQMKAHFINVGQSDATLLEFEEGAILIDAGGEFTGDSLHQDHLVGYLRDFFDRRSDLDRTLSSIIVTHPHIDHTRHLMSVMQRFRVNALIDGGDQHGSGIYPLFLARQFADDNGIRHLKIADGDIPDEGGLSNAVIDPFAGDPEIVILAGERGCQEQNNDSLVVRVETRGKSFLFTGDAEFEKGQGCGLPEIDLLLERYGDTGELDVDVYQVGHHGSRNGTNLELMRAMSPQISVISAGYRFRREPEPFHASQFGHPRSEVVEILVAETSGTRSKQFLTSNANSPYSLPKANKPKQVDKLDMIKQVYCTCWDGDIVVAVDEAGELRVTPSGL